MQVNRVKVHNYLGMEVDYTTVGQVKITILGYIFFLSTGLRVPKACS